ncbi:hypothetical protein U1Q18_016301 [Sarracenia purpurea var. burkii]
MAIRLQRIRLAYSSTPEYMDFWYGLEWRVSKRVKQVRQNPKGTGEGEIAEEKWFGNKKGIGFFRTEDKGQEEAKPGGNDASSVVFSDGKPKVWWGFNDGGVFHENKGLLRRGIRRRIRNNKGFGFSPNKSSAMVDLGVWCGGLASGFQRRRRVSIVLPEGFQRQWFQEGFGRRRRASPEREEVGVRRAFRRLLWIVRGKRTATRVFGRKGNARELYVETPERGISWVWVKIQSFNVLQTWMVVTTTVQGEGGGEGRRNGGGGARKTAARSKAPPLLDDGPELKSRLPRKPFFLLLDRQHPPISKI